MRPTLLLLAALLFSFTLPAQDLVTFDPAEGPEAFAETLKAFFYGTGNKAAKDAYADFNGVFFGGGLDESQQTRVAATSVAMANLRVSATAGFIDYVGAVGEIVDTSKTNNPLFDQFHDALDRVLADPEVRITTINNALETANTYLRTQQFKKSEDGTGWSVKGGKPSFLYDGEMKMRVDTVRQLQAIAAKDTLNIQETQLLVDLATKRIFGKGGRTDWQRAGLSPDVFVILVNYEIDANRLLYKSDSAQFQYPEYFGDEIQIGDFADKIQPAGPRPDAEYPQFLSDDEYVEIKNVGKNTTLFGSFELRGSTIYAIGKKGREAQVRLRLQGSATDRSVVGLGRRFIVRQGKSISGESIELTVYVGKDSLYHPSVTMHVDIEKRIVGLRRTDSSADQSPFYHSKNEMAIYSDFMDIHMEGDSAIIGKPTVSFQEKPDVIFESGDFYSLREYQFMQDIAATNPLERLYAYRQNMNGGLDDMHADDLAKSFRPEFTAKDIQPLLFDLQTRGFLLYDSESKMILLKPKLVKFVEAYREERDYDRLRIVSRTKGQNAVMDMVTGEIRVNEILPLEFNREKKIAIQPSGRSLVINNNRDLDFDGTIYAGNMILTGKDFHYRYDMNYIELDSVRYVDIFLPADPKDAETSGEMQSTASRIEHVSGYLLVDAPKNKSGTENLPYFPSLQTKGSSYIYYDRGDTLSNFDRDSFYFELQPFSINGADSLTVEDLALTGKLNSGGIFPEFEETLSLQEDGSFGFTAGTPEGGRTAYDGRGTYDGEMNLTNDGLRGSGNLNYLEANLESDDLVFGVYQTTGTSNAFEMEEASSGARSTPQVRSSAVNFALRPYGDSLIVETQEGSTFDLFKAGEHQLRGTLVLTPEALQANGTLDWSAASLTSGDMRFSKFGASADTATVGIKALDGDGELALKTTNVAATMDFGAGTATFKNNSTDLATQLPFTQFNTSINEFDWDMARNVVTFRAEEGKDRFTSVHPDQDSLTFTGEAARFDVNTSVLEVDGVPYVEVADARIYPADGTIAVEGGAKVRELTNARIVADTINEYHVMNRATVQINGRKEYTASGFYEYNVGPHTQEVEFQEIVGTRVGKGAREEKATATRAEGTVEEDAGFYIDQKTRFFGTMNLDAGSKTLLFDGYAKIDADQLPGAQWFTIRSEGDKKNLTLEVREPKDRDGAPLFTGIYLSKPNRNMYPSLVQTLDFRKDHPILDANGLMNYDEENDVFLFGDSLRIFDESVRTGNLMKFDDGAGTISGSGRLGIGGRLKYINLDAYGTIKMDMPSGSRFAARVSTESEVEQAEEEEPEDPPSMFLLEEETVEAEGTTAQTGDEPTLTIDAEIEPDQVDVLSEAMMAIDLILPDKLVNLMATDIVAGTYASPQLNTKGSEEFLRAGLETLFEDSPQRAGALASVEANIFDVPREINEHTFLFPRVKLKWSHDYQSFVSTESMSGLASVRGNPVGKMVETQMEIKMPTGGDDRLYLYIKSPSELYYFFGFKDGVLNVTSNNTQFMDELENTKARQLIREMDDGQTYEILPVSPATAETFLRRMKSAF